jgi:hypothetical protein
MRDEAGEFMDTITVYSNEDLTTFDRSYVDTLDALSEPDEELTGRFQYVISLKDYQKQHSDWNRDKDPMLKVFDQLSRRDIYVSTRAAERINEAVKKKADSVQLF